MVLSIVSCKLPGADNPVVGVTLEPYLTVRKPEGGAPTTAGDIPEEGSTDARFALRLRWYRSQVNKSGLVCGIHPDREATLQCTICARYAQTVAEKRQSYHCSPDCLKQSWSLHRELHAKFQKRAQGQLDNGYKGQQHLDAALKSSPNNAETWLEVGRGKKYAPSEEDCGSALKVDVIVIDTQGRQNPEIGRTFTVVTQRVKAAPEPPKRNLIPLPSQRLETAAGRFSVLTYNLLADLYANKDQFACPQWMLSWSYRRQNLLNELVSYRADILCLQEVQSNHFTDFLQPGLEKHGYAAVYKKKTTEMFTSNKYTIDGCATFYRRDRFALVKKYEVEFNKAALSLAEGVGGADLKRVALNRLLKDNVALIAVLEALDPPQFPEERMNSASSEKRRQLVCVANTHIHANPELSDVKLWQVNTLIKGLEKIAASCEIPMIVTGDFNSPPGSAAHDLLTKQSVRDEHKNDPVGMFTNPAAAIKLQSNLLLASAYSSVLSAKSNDPALQKLRKCMDPRLREPKFTNLSKNFKGTLDYIFYTPESLVPVSTLELPEESEIMRLGGLPNEIWSSDHIALIAEFQYIQA